MAGEPVFPAESSDSEGRIGRSGRSGSGISVFRPIGLVVALLLLGWGGLTLWDRYHPPQPWVQGLKSGDPAERVTAADRLGREGREDLDAAVTSLVKTLQDSDARVRAAAAAAMVLLMSPGAPAHRPDHIDLAVAALLPCLHDPEPVVRAAATKAVWMVIFLGRAPATTADLVPIMMPLIERLDDADASVRLEAIRGVASVGPKVSDDVPAELLASLEDESQANRDAAALAVAAYRKGLPGLLPSMVQSLEARSPRFRSAFLKILEDVHPRRLPPEALPGFISALRSPDPEVVRLAIANILAYNDEAGIAAPELSRTLDRALQVESPKAAPPGRATPDLALVVTEGLRRVARGSKQQNDAVSALSKSLQPDRDPALRIAAAKALGQFRPDPALFAALTQYIGDRDPKVRHAVIWTIHDVDFAEGYIVPKALALALEDPSAETRVDAAAAICHSGLGADPFVPALVDHALHDPVQEVRSMCATALSMLKGGKITAASIPHLIRGLDGTEPNVRESLCQALARFGPDAASAVPALIRLMKDTADPYPWTYRRFAASALGGIAPATPHADQAVAALIEFLRLDDKSPPEKWMLEATIHALAEFGPKATGAIPGLRELQRADDEEVRKAATRALASIERAR